MSYLFLYTFFEFSVIENLFTAPAQNYSNTYFRFTATDLAAEGVHFRVAPFIRRLFDASLRSGRVPQSFKSAYITPLLKKAGLDNNDVKN